MKAIELPAPKSRVVGTWQWRMCLFCIAVAGVYAPALREAARVWTTNDNYAHGMFVFPVAAYLIWRRWPEITKAAPSPSPWGLPLAALGLGAQCASYLLCIRYVGMWSLLLTLTGGALALHGPAFWKLCRFPIGFLLFAAPMPHAVLRDLTLWIQSASTTGAAFVMYWLGIPLRQHGNVIEILGLSVQVAEACSGFHKLVSLTAIALLYAAIRGKSAAQTGIMLLSVLPVALIANILRICTLIAFGYWGGAEAAHRAHNSAELVSIGLAFAALAGIERSCRWSVPTFMRPCAA